MKMVSSVPSRSSRILTSHARYTIFHVFYQVCFICSTTCVVYFTWLAYVAHDFETKQDRQASANASVGSAVNVSWIKFGFVQVI